MQNNGGIYIIIPVFNDVEHIGDVISGLLQNGYSNIVLIDDGSTDSILNRIADLPVYFMRHRVNLGQGAALQTGLNFVKLFDARIIVTFDADGQHRAEDINRLIAP